MTMRRTLTAIAVSAASFAAVTTVAQASTAAPQARHAGAAAVKAPKAESYTHCETFWGCSTVPFLVYRKTKTWEFEGFSGTEYSGTFEKVGKLTVFHFSHGFDCDLIVKRVKNKNYVGQNSVACGSEGVELRFNG